MLEREAGMFTWLWPEVCLGCGERGAAWCGWCAPGGPIRPPVRVEGIEAGFAVERYDRPVGDALRRAKLGGDRRAVCALASLFADRLGPHLASARLDAVVPAPSTARARGRRGFATAPLLADAMGRRLGLPVVDALTSEAPGRLARLSASARRQALRGRVRGRLLVRGRVLLVDDVLTTGATADACATELLGGASDAVVLATLCAVPAARRAPTILARGA